MFRDHSLVPAEAIRLAALGFLAEAPWRYADLSAEIRHLTSRIVGPSPERLRVARPHRCLSLVRGHDD